MTCASADVEPETGSRCCIRSAECGVFWLSCLVKVRVFHRTTEHFPFSNPTGLPTHIYCAAMPHPYPHFWTPVANLLAALRALLRHTAPDAFASIALEARTAGRAHRARPLLHPFARPRPRYFADAPRRCRPPGGLGRDGFVIAHLKLSFACGGVRVFVQSAPASRAILRARKTSLSTASRVNSTSARLNVCGAATTSRMKAARASRSFDHQPSSPP